MIQYECHCGQRLKNLKHQHKVFEALCPEIDFSDETIQKIQVHSIQFQANCSQNLHFQGILETNMKEIRLAASDAVGVYALAAMMEHSCMPNIKMTFDKQFNVSSDHQHIIKFYQIIFHGPHYQQR